METIYNIIIYAFTFNFHPETNEDVFHNGYVVIAWILLVFVIGMIFIWTKDWIKKK